MKNAVLSSSGFLLVQYFWKVLKMKNIYLIATVTLMSSASFAAIKMTCSNKDAFGSNKMQLTIGQRFSQVTYKGESCRMTPIEYNPNSPRYKGWMRFAPDQGGSDDCAEVGRAMFGVTDIRNEPIEIHWISVSKEVQAGKEGFVQLGFQNDLDPGAGGTAKIFLRCSVDKR